MTVKIRDKELYDTYKYTMAAVANRALTLTDTLKVLSDYIILKDLTRDHDGDISTIIKAIIDGEPVKLVEPKYFCYLEIPHCGGSDALQISFQGNGYACTFINLGDFYTYNDCQFTQSEVDELKADYPYIQTKEVDD